MLARGLSMDLKLVEIKCQGAERVPLDQLKGFQGNLKDLSHENYEKLKLELLRHGFSEPISVWKRNGEYLILNGHQRVRTLTAMRDEGYKVPDLPVSVVEAKDEKEAKEKILALTSQFGEITEQGLYEFTQVAGIDFEYLETLRMPEIDLSKYHENFFEAKSPGDDSEPVSETHCSKCGTLLVKP